MKGRLSKKQHDVQTVFLLACHLVVSAGVDWCAGSSTACHQQTRKTCHSQQNLCCLKRFLGKFILNCYPEGVNFGLLAPEWNNFGLLNPNFDPWANQFRIAKSKSGQRLNLPCNWWEASRKGRFDQSSDMGAACIQSLPLLKCSVIPLKYSNGVLQDAVVGKLNS